MQEEGRILRTSSMGSQPVTGLLRDEGRRVMPGVEHRAPGLRRLFGRACRIGRAAQGRTGNALPRQPAGKVATDLITVFQTQHRLVKTVIRQGHTKILVLPGTRQFAAIFRPVAPSEIGLTASWHRRLPRYGIRCGLGHVLEMCLAKKRRPVTGFAEAGDEGMGAQGNGNAVTAHPGGTRHPPGQDRRPVGHAHRGIDVKTVKDDPTGGKGIDMGRSDLRIAISPQMIRPLLIGHDQQEVRTLVG